MLIRRYNKMIINNLKVIIDWIPIRANLAVQNVLPPEVSILCVMCNRKVESSLHLFLHCDVARLVWIKLMNWLECLFLIPPNRFVHWECWCGGESNRKVAKGLWLIWHTTIWVLWKARNDKIFKGFPFEVDVIVEDIKVLSWRWKLSRTLDPACLFYEWCWNPRHCLSR